MTQVFAIAVGGAIGAMLRFWLSTGVYSMLGRGFPYGTLVVNVVGSLLMGVLYILLIERMALDVIWRAGLLIGVLGAFTTFSTFSIETLMLLEQGEGIKAVANVLITVLVCLLATWVGMGLGRQL
ncbi:MAG: fluoride efflux transporter CrcB [Gammaproteobacteria bacterium]|nr:fluoride efflux transporter CrcB [Gammaproteobacteria bacterium]